MTLYITQKFEDLLAMQLFMTTRSKPVRNRARNFRYIFGVGYLFLGVFLFVLSSKTPTTVFGVALVVLGFAFLLFWPKYYQWRLKNTLIKNLNHNHSAMFGQKIELEITENGVGSKSEDSNAHYKPDGIEVIYSTMGHYFVIIRGNLGMCIPKDQVENEMELELVFEGMGKTVVVVSV